MSQKEMISSRDQRRNAFAHLKKGEGKWLSPIYVIYTSNGQNKMFSLSKNPAETKTKTGRPTRLIILETTLREKLMNRNRKEINAQITVETG